MSEVKAIFSEGNEKRKAERQRVAEEKGSPSVRLDATLSMPVIEGIFDDGLIPVELLNEKMTVAISEWPRVREDDYIFVFLDNENLGYIANASIDDPDLITFPFEIDVTTRLFTHGEHELQYIVESASGARALSQPAMIIVDREPPVPAGPISLPESFRNTITREDLDENQGVVPLSIPFYLRIETGDTIRVMWIGANGHASRLPEYTITADDIINKTITIEVDQEVIYSGEEGNARAYYNIYDRAGNVSSRSPDYSIAVILNPAATNIQAPYIPLADDSVITDADTREPVYARIPKYQNILPGDVITLRWRSVPVFPNYTVPYPVPQEAFVLDIPVPRSTIWESGSGSWEVDFLVTRGTVVQISPTTNVTVDLAIPGPEDPNKDTIENEKLLPLTVLGNVSKQDNVLLPGDLRQGGTALVPRYLPLKVEEIIRIYWGGRSSNLVVDYKVKDSDLTSTEKNFTIPLPASLIDTTAESPTWPVTYDLLNSKNSNPGMMTFVDVHLVGPGGPTGLDAVQFLGKNARGWLIEGNTVNPSTSVLVKAYDNMAVGDEVTLHWQGNSKTNSSGQPVEGTSYSDTVVVEQRHIREGVIFPVPYSPYIKNIGYGSAIAFYTVRQKGLDFDSVKDFVKVDLEGPAG